MSTTPAPPARFPAVLCGVLLAGAAGTLTAQTPDAAVITRLQALHEAMPLALSAIHGGVKSGRPGPIETPRVRFEALQERVGDRVVAWLRQQFAAAGAPDGPAFAETERGMREKVRLLYAPLLIQNTYHAWRTFAGAGGEVLDCAAADWRAGPGGSRTTVCVERADAEGAALRIEAGDYGSGVWELRDGADGYVLVDVVSEVDEEVVFVIGMGK